MGFRVFVLGFRVSGFGVLAFRNGAEAFRIKFRGVGSRNLEFRTGN